jgi:hypothetical protein
MARIERQSFITFNTSKDASLGTVLKYDQANRIWKAAGIYAL